MFTVSQRSIAEKLEILGFHVKFWPTQTAKKGGTSATPWVRREYISVTAATTIQRVALCNVRTLTL